MRIYNLINESFDRKYGVKKKLKEKKLTEAPDEFGFMTDDEIDRDYSYDYKKLDKKQAKLDAEREATSRRQQSDKVKRDKNKEEFISTYKDTGLFNGSIPVGTMLSLATTPTLRNSLYRYLQKYDSSPLSAIYVRDREEPASLFIVVNSRISGVEILLNIKENSLEIWPDRISTYRDIVKKDIKTLKGYAPYAFYGDVDRELKNLFAELSGIIKLDKISTSTPIGELFSKLKEAYEYASSIYSQLKGNNEEIDEKEFFSAIEEYKKMKNTLKESLSNKSFNKRLVESSSYESHGKFLKIFIDNLIENANKGEYDPSDLVEIFNEVEDFMGDLARKKNKGNQRYLKKD